MQMNFLNTALLAAGLLPAMFKDNANCFNKSSIGAINVAAIDSVVLSPTATSSSWFKLSSHKPKKRKERLDNPNPMPQFLKNVLAYINQNPQQHIDDHQITVTFPTINGKKIKVVSDFEDINLNNEISPNEIYNLEVFDVKKPNDGEQYQVNQLDPKNELQKQLLYFLANKIESNYVPQNGVYTFRQYQAYKQKKPKP